MQFMQQLLAYRRVVIAISLAFLFLTLVHLLSNTSIGYSHALFSSPQPSDLPQVGPVEKPTSAQLERSQKPTLDIVVSLYNEDINQTSAIIEQFRTLPTFRHLEVQVHVYTKYQDADVQLIRNTIDTPFVTILPNLGREGGTFFDHIILMWDRLARHTMFIQAFPHELEPAKGRIIDYFGPTTGVLSLGIYESCDCTDCTDPWDSTRKFPRLEELYSALNGQFCPKSLTLTYLGQFIASATRIRQRGLKTYMYLKQILEADSSNFIHTDQRQAEFRDDVSNPYFGHTIERSWMILFGCSEPRFAEDCKSWQGLWNRRTPFDADDKCQCLDEVRVS